MSIFSTRLLLEHELQTKTCFGGFSIGILNRKFLYWDSLLELPIVIVTVGSLLKTLMKIEKFQTRTTDPTTYTTLKLTILHVCVKLEVGPLTLKF